MMLIGTSGWQYRDWKGRFYPADLPQRAWLEHYAGAFGTVEVNNAFYRLPERDTFVAWRERTPADFVVTVKASRYLTHVRRLRDPAEPVGRLMERAAGLGDKLGPILLQLPPTMRVDAAALDAALAQFPAGVRLAVEPRHESWWVEEVRQVLTDRGAALCWADRGSRPLTPLWQTAGWGYLRLHEGRAGRGSPNWPGYGRTALRSWVTRTAEFKSQEVYVYFNNDPGGAAVRDAIAFGRLARARSVPVGRVPDRP